MKYIILLFCIIGFSFADSVKNDIDDLIINKNFTLNKKVEPIYLFANINIESSSLLRNIGELSNENRKNITTTLNSIIEEAKKGDICKGGSYSINPIINYDKGNRKTIGQNVDFMLNCKFIESSDLKNYNAFLANINKKISANKLLSLPQPSLFHNITDDEINTTKEEMFSEFLKDIKTIEDKYSKLANKICKINDISANDSYTPSPISRQMENTKMMATSEDSTATIAPVVNQKDIRIDVKLKLICK